MLKKKNISVEDVMRSVAEENGFTYVPPGKRKPKEIVIEKDGSNDVKIKFVDRKSGLSHKVGKLNVLKGEGKRNTNDTATRITKSEQRLASYKAKVRKRLEKTNKNCG